jgi:hypothetical protein
MEDEENSEIKTIKDCLLQLSNEAFGTLKKTKFLAFLCCCYQNNLSLILIF